MKEVEEANKAVLAKTAEVAKKVADDKRRRDKPLLTKGCRREGAADRRPPTPRNLTQVG